MEDGKKKIKLIKQFPKTNFFYIAPCSKQKKKKVVENFKSNTGGAVRSFT